MDNFVVLISCEELPKYHNSNNALPDDDFRGLFLALFQAATRRRAVHFHQHLITYATNEMDRERERRGWIDGGTPVLVQNSAKR